MPQTRSAAKALRAARRRRATNNRWRRQVRTSIAAVRAALKVADRTAAQQALRAAMKVLSRAARRHIIHPNAARRKTSRLSRALKKL